MRRLSTSIFILFVAVAMLTGCESADNETSIPDSSIVAEPVQEAEVPPEVEPADWEIEFRRVRLIGDLLYDALRALEQDRLLTPVDNNAHARYQRVLALDPGNELAQQGLQTIVRRYLELATMASRQGRFAEAQTLLDRARFVDASVPAIADAQRELDADMRSGDLVFELDGQAVASQSEALQTQLATIAAQAIERHALVWITAPTDAQGRWIYGVMRESTAGYRLRGNIELGSHAIVRLRTPEPVPGEAPGGDGVNPR